MSSGQTAIRRIERMDTSETGCCFGGEVPPFSLALLPAELKPKRLARHTQLALWAARQIKAEVEELPKSPSIRLGVATSCVSMISHSVLTQFQRTGSVVPRYTVAQSPPHAASSAIAKILWESGKRADGLDRLRRRHGRDRFGGPGHCLGSGRPGDCRRRRLRDQPQYPGGFCERRLGFRKELVSGEGQPALLMFSPIAVFAQRGACLVLLEEKSDALARGATILAEIAGYGSCLDPDPRVPGSGWSNSIREALEDAGWSPATIDSISAWGPDIRCWIESKRQFSRKFSDASPRMRRSIPSRAPSAIP